MDIEKLRQDFPILGRIIDSNPLIYFDNAATSQKPNMIIDAVSDFYRKYNSNVLRGVYPLAEQATQMYEDARQKVSIFVNAYDSSEIIFTGGTTEGINFIANSWAHDSLKEGDEIVLTEVEHHANFLPWVLLAEKKGLKLKFIKINPQTFKLEFDPNLITEKTKLVSVIHSSNVLGDVWSEGQLEEMIQKANAVGAKVLIDSAQSVAHKKIDIQKLNPAFLVFSGHKILGPTGIGVLYIKKDLHEKVKPYRVGGSMVRSAVSECPIWNESPQKFEAGTPPIAQAVGLGSAIDYLTQNINFEELKKYEAKLCEKLIDGLLKIPGIHIVGNIVELKKQGHLVSFFVDGMHVHDVASMLGNKNICTRAGHHCAQPLSAKLKIESSLRVSFYFYNNEKEVDIFLKELKSVISFLKK
ncbi:MAG: SufS family cysteine desulfurase [bacterium]